MDIARFDRATRAVNALGEAGSVRDARGQAYAGALNGVIRVHRESTVFPVRAAALRRLLEATPHASAVAYLKSVAESSDETAMIAAVTATNCISLLRARRALNP